MEQALWNLLFYGNLGTVAATPPPRLSQNEKVDVSLSVTKARVAMSRVLYFKNGILHRLFQAITVPTLNMIRTSI